MFDFFSPDDLINNSTIYNIKGAVANNLMGYIGPTINFKLRVNRINIKETIHKGGSIPYFCFRFIMT